MKFICPSCKAKYQIADEKVADRSVRMKCRKCERIIRITSQGAELSQSAPPDATPSVRPVAVSSRPLAPRAGGPVAPRASVPRAGRPLSPPAPATASPAARAAAPRASSPGSPRPVGGLRPPARPQASAPRSAPRAATSAAVSAVESPRAPAAPKSAPKPASGVAVKPAVEPSEAATKKKPEVENQPGSALEGAFSAAVQAPGADLDQAVGDEWFVGINGVPVGPIKLSELRSKAAAGSVTRDSLVWRDGFEEWKPLGTFPELVAIVEESTSSPGASREPLTDDATMLAISTVAAPPRVEIAAVQPSSITTDDTDELEQLAGLKRRGGLSLPQVFAMVVAILFGLTMGFVVFSGTEKTKEVVKYVKVPSETEQSRAQAEQTSAQAEGDSAQAEETDDKAKPATAGARVAKTNQASGNTGDKQTGLKGLSGLSGLAAGPANGPAGNQATNSSSGRPLDSASVQSTVSRYTGSVKRSCWQPALDTRDPNAPTSARVVVTITVAPSGAVQNVGTSGDPKGYRGLATCIARRVRGWQFPASSGTTTVNVPFVFAAQ